MSSRDGFNVNPPAGENVRPQVPPKAPPYPFSPARPDLENENARLRAEIDNLRKDAARYCWLRDKSEAVHGFYLSTPIWMTGVRFRAQDVDRTIDDAMAFEDGSNG